MADRVRKTNRFSFRGLNTQLLSDAMPQGKYPLAIDIRALGDSQVRVRPGYVSSFGTTSQALTDIKAYSTLSTDNNPRFLVHNRAGQIWLDNGTLKSTLGSPSFGASMIPFRPNASPQSWMYICNGIGYRKLSAPDGSNNVTDYKVGIAEPQSPPEACPEGRQYTKFSGTSGNWTNSGTAGATSDTTRSTDTATAVFEDPASTANTKTRWSVQVSTSVQYQVDEILTLNRSGGGSYEAVVEDVYPAIALGGTLTIQSIFYFTGSTGKCVIVPSQIPLGNAEPPANPTQSSSNLPPQLSTQLAGLRRGSLVQLQSSSEVVFVLSVTSGPQSQIAFECSTTGTHTAGETITGVQAICVSGIDATVVGQTVSGPQINSVIGKGIGTLTQTLSTNPFNVVLGTIGVPQATDLLHVSLTADLPGNITELKFLFDVGDGSFTKNVLYFAVQSSTLQQAINNQITQQNAAGQLINPQATYQALVNAGESSILALETVGGIQAGNLQLIYDPTTGQATLHNNHTGQNTTLNIQFGSGVGQYTEVTISLSSLLRIGNDQSKTLSNCGKVQILANVTASTVIGFGALWVGGAGQPNVGVNGSPYFYRVVPVSDITGAPGNPSPATKYGVLPRAQQVRLTLPSAAYDGQISRWDIYRYGGATLSYRRIGSALSTATTFLDNVLDTSAFVGQELQFDNFEPWPTVDVPWIATAGSGGITSITVSGTVIVVIGSTFPATISRWLPGTLITLDGQYTYTLWNRPVTVSGGWLFRLLQNASNPTVSVLSVQEPDVANQQLPYSWGPDSNGIVFACGDPLRPGFLYWAKPNSPDATPNNPYDLTTPSEPLMGGMIIDGQSLVASSLRWWQLQEAFSTPRYWNPVEMPIGRGLAAPFGKCTDGKAGYFVAKDGIYKFVPNAPAVSLSDSDIGNLFPLDGPARQNYTYASQVIYAPDYRFAALFRLGIVNDFLRFHYYSADTFIRTIELDMNVMTNGEPRMAWGQVQFNDPIVTSYQPEGPQSTLIADTTIYNQCYLPDTNGNVWIEKDLASDRNHVINPMIAIPEQDFGDARVQKQWMDVWLDLNNPASINMSQVVNGFIIATQTIAAFQGRTNPIMTLRPGALTVNANQFEGLLFTWAEALDIMMPPQPPTLLYEWSMEFVPQPVLVRTWQSVPTSHGMQGYHHIGTIRFAYATIDANPATLSFIVFDGTAPQNITLPGTNAAFAKVEIEPTFNKAMLYTYVVTHPTGFVPIEEDCEILVGAWDRSGPYSVFTGLGGIENQ